MHTSHGTIQGYNGQAIVDSNQQVIGYGQAIGKGLDNDNLPPVVDAAKQNLESIGKGKHYFEGKILTADSSDHSVSNINIRYKNAKHSHLTYYADALGNNISQATIKKIETEKGHSIYPPRIAIVETVFANICVNKRLGKFNLRGKIKVNIQ